MPPTTGTEPAPIPASAETAPPERLFSPAGIVLLIAIMAAEAVVVYWISGVFRGPRIETLGTPDFGENYAEVLLEKEYHKQYPLPDAVNYTEEHFRLRVGFVLNPRYDDLTALRQAVERRKQLLQSRTFDVIDRKSETQLRHPEILDTLKNEIRDEVNQILGATDDGQEIVFEVIFPDRTRLQPRK